MPGAPASPQAPADAPASGGIREEVRRALLSRRRAQPAARAAELSLAAQERLLASPCWREAARVALYAGVRGDVATDLLLREAWATGREVWLPRVRSVADGLMDFVRCPGPESLRPGAFGLNEPRPELPGAGPGDAAFQPQLFLLPGVAFDRHGSRMGHGGGFYDRFLGARARMRQATGGRARACPLLGFCFGFQIVEELPRAAWDQPVDGLCTEGELFWISR